MTQNGNRLLDSQACDGPSFIDAIHTEPIGSFRSYRSDRFEPVTISVGFHDDHQRGSRSGYSPERVDVASQPLRINFYPRQHEGIISTGQNSNWEEKK